MEDNFYMREAHYIDEVLRIYLMRVYTYMMLGLGLTSITSHWVSSSLYLFDAIFKTPFIWVILIVPLILIYYIGSRIHILSPSFSQIFFYIMKRLQKTWLATIFVPSTIPLYLMK